MIGAHTDSPGLQLKPNLQSNSGPYTIGGVEKYGGAILHTWFDRELSIAGRAACLLSNGESVSLLVDLLEPVAYIPSLAIHFNREVNKNLEINVQTDMSPVIGQGNTGDLEFLLLAALRNQYPGQDVNSVHGFDLFCYDPASSNYFGLDNEFIGAPRLDNLASCVIGLESIMHASDSSNTMLIFTNHEEIGSTSNSGALGNLADIVLTRICGDTEEKGICLHNSYLMSLDNAHASHPNFSDKSDADHPIFLNGGPVVKLNANQRYSSNARTGAVFRILAAETEVPTQDFVMRSDMVCGSTIGPLSSSQLGVDGVDVGIPTWGMHSIREVTGSNDPYLLYQVVSHYLGRKSLPRF
jgi:aspartyl aminopeptidase